MANHHGQAPYAELVKRLKNKLGPLGDYPEGALNEHDEGAIQFAVGNENGKVLVDFGAPVSWLAMEPEQAMELAELLIKHARQGNKSVILRVTI